MLVRLGLSFVLAMFAVGTAMAAQVAPENKAAMQMPCADDFAALCIGLPPEDSTETRACFVRNTSKLSPGCREAINT
ncbi:hypothetical protein FV230_06825 [Methylobacterium sp. WL6]|nr:hypothetical protein FV230_06825 [Methylobacterium sp. WL6]